MGAINYSTSDYITLGLRPYDYDDFKNDAGFMKEIRRECEEYGGTVDDAIDSYIDDCYEADFVNIQHELDKHDFYYYNVTIEAGYYEGFCLNIENNYPVALDSWEDRREASKEITEIKEFLIECAGFGLVQCFPGWCTTYNDYRGTIKAIDAAVKDMRDELRAIPTWSQYVRSYK